MMNTNTITTVSTGAIANGEAKAKKITKKQQFAVIKAMLENQEQTELAEFIQHEIDLLDKKASSKRKTDNTEQLNEVYEYLKGMKKPCKVNEIISAYKLLPPMTSAKLTYFLGQLCDDGRATKEKIKGTNTYTAIL